MRAETSGWKQSPSPMPEVLGGENSQNGISELDQNMHVILELFLVRRNQKGDREANRNDHCDRACYCVITISSLAYGQRQTTAHHREHNKCKLANCMNVRRSWAAIAVSAVTHRERRKVNRSLGELICLIIAKLCTRRPQEWIMRRTSSSIRRSLR